MAGIFTTSRPRATRRVLARYGFGRLAAVSVEPGVDVNLAARVVAVGAVAEHTCDNPDVVSLITGQPG